MFMTDDAAPTASLIDLTADVVAAYVANNTVAAAELPRLIASVHEALAGAAAPAETVLDEPAPVRAVTVRKSLANPNRILSMIDGKPYASLIRHLRAHDLTPDDYRARYGLAADYPMVAPGYSEKRRAAAKAIGLGRKPGETPKQAGRPAKAAAAPAPAKPGRKPRGAKTSG